MYPPGQTIVKPGGVHLAGGRGVLVAGTESPDVVELWGWTLGPGDQHESEAHSPGTKELLQVQQGSSGRGHATFLKRTHISGLQAGLQEMGLELFSSSA